MSRIRFKACPKCHGDVYLDCDIFNKWYQSCLQCGHITYFDTIIKTKDNGKPAKEVAATKKSRIAGTK